MSSHPRKSIRIRLLVACIVLTCGCSAAEDSPKSASGGSGGASGGTGGSDDTGGTAGDSAGTGGSSGADPNNPPAVLPFAADTYFIPSGYMGDAITPGVVVVDKTCMASRPPGAVGNCYKVTYQPLTDPLAQKWAGIYWQYPQDNWGDKPGKNIAPGASKVTFYAAGGEGGEVVKFLIGGISDAAKSYHDTMKVEQEVTLTAQMTQYTLDLTGQPAEAVLGGFAWSLAAPASEAGAASPDPDGSAVDPGGGAPGPIVFWLDAVEWQ